MAMYFKRGKIYFQELFPGMKNIISRKNLYFQEKVISRKIPGNKDREKNSFFSMRRSLGEIINDLFILINLYNWRENFTKKNVQKINI